LQQAAEGKTSAEIAAALFISPRTAETHRANLMRKLSLRSQTDLVRFAIRRKIISA
jgi:DNA-binding CsgD family transcriptional regulator